MSYSNMSVDWTDIIRFTSEGIVVADYSQIRTALVDKFKAIYGDDIDVSTTSADGIYLETLSLMVNNILQAFKSFYGNLDIRFASGTFLDMLCALSNVTRKAATSSTCNLAITLDSSETTYTTNEIKFVDNGGLVWKWSSVDSMTFTPGVETQITVACETVGPVRADAGTVANDYLDGWINRTVNATPLIAVRQRENAALGSYIETDVELRARQHSSGNSSANTVLESLAGALLQVGGIEDVLFYNNNTGSTIQAKDLTNIARNSVYVVIRVAQNANIPDKQIGMILHDKLTPGVCTNPSAEVAHQHEYAYAQYIEGVPIGQTQYFRWKQAYPANPPIVVTIVPNSYFASANDSTCNKIANNIIDEVNNMHISDTLTNFRLTEIVSYSDPLFRNKPTYSIESITVNNSTNDYGLADTYFYYTSFTIDDSTVGKYIITIT